MRREYQQKPTPNTDAGIIWQGFEHNHHKNATMTNYEHSERKEKIWHKEMNVLEKILEQKKVPEKILEQKKIIEKKFF